MPQPKQTPAALGFRMPAEWEPQEAVWLSWPHRRTTWPGHFRPIPAKFAEIAAHISRREKVRMNVARPHAARAPGRWSSGRGADMAQRRVLRPPHQRRLVPRPRPDLREERPNGRGGGDRLGVQLLGRQASRPSTWTTGSPARIARALGLRRFRIGMVLEGGSIDVNGAGLLLTTESCLLNPNRNPHAHPGRDRAQPAGLPRRARGPLAGRRASRATTRTGTSTT